MLNLQTIININQLLKKDIDIISEKYLLNNKGEYSAFSMFILMFVFRLHVSKSILVTFIFVVFLIYYL